MGLKPVPAVSQVLILALRFGQTRGQDPHELGGRRRAHPGPRIHEVVLDGRVRQAKAVSGCLLRSCDEHSSHDDDLAVRRAFGRAGRPASHALRTSSRGTGGSRGVALTIRKLSDR